MNLLNALIVDDEPHCLDILLTMLDEFRDTIEPHTACGASKALDIANHMRIDLMITDLNMPEMGGIHLIDEIQRIWPDCLIIILTAYPDFDTAKEAITRQVFEYIVKLEMRIELPRVLKKAIEEIRRRNQAQISSGEEAIRFSRQAFFCLLEIPSLSGDEKKRLLTLLGFKEETDSVYAVLIGKTQAQDNVLNTLIMENGGANLLASICQTQKDGYPVILMQIRNNISSTWLFSVLETVQERLHAINCQLSMSVSLVQNNDFDKAYRETLHSLTHNADCEREMIFTIDSGVSPLLRSSTDYSEQITQKIIRYVSEHIGEDVSLTCLSGVLGYSRAYISTVFHENTGIQLQQYIIRQRLTYIQTLMKNKSLSLNTIAEMSGFGSVSYFSRFVKRETGMSPREYRLNLSE